MKALLLVLALLCIAGTCESQVAATRSAGTVPFRTAVLFVSELTPPPEYARWYAWAERCTGLSGDYRGVRWLTAPEPWGANPDSLTYGMWQRDGRRITLNNSEKMDSTLVIHESIHDIVGLHPEYQDTAVHPVALYTGKCSWRQHGDLHRPVHP